MNLQSFFNLPRWLPFAGALLLLTPHLAWAQAPWTLAQALVAAQTTHPALQGKRAAQGAARADQASANWQRYPTLSMEAATQNGGTHSGLVRLEQPLWNGGRIQAGIDAADSRSRMADAALEEARLDLSLRVIATFVESQRQQARLAHAQAGVMAHEQLLSMIRRRVAQEVSSQTDERLAQSRFFQAVNERSLAQQALTNALASLTQLVGQDARGVVEASAPGAYTLTDQLTTVAQAVTVSPVLHRLMFEEQAAQADVSAKQSSTKPQLALRLEKNLGQTYDQRVMLVLLAQPGAGLSAFSGIEAALARAEAVRQAKESARRDVQERVLLDWNEWTHAQQRLDNAQHFQAINTEVFESYKRQYVAGRKTWVDVLNAVREATQAQLALEDARAQANAAAWRLTALTGQLYTAESNPK